MKATTGTCRQYHGTARQHLNKMNQIAIDLNNRGVQALERGDSVSAFQAFSKAANITMVLIENHRHISSGAHSFQFHWINCDHPSLLLRKEGCAPFLFLRALTISSPRCGNHQVNNLCPCGFAWAIWFNLALCCSILGTKLGEKGRLFMEMAHDLYGKVQRRVESEPPSRHWQMLAMAISNNQACIFSELSMQQASLECLKRLAVALSSCKEIEVEDRGDFCLNLQILGSQTIAAAA